MNALGLVPLTLAIAAAAEISSRQPADATALQEWSVSTRRAIPLSGGRLGIWVGLTNNSDHDKCICTELAVWVEQRAMVGSVDARSLTNELLSAHACTTQHAATLVAGHGTAYRLVLADRGEVPAGEVSLTITFREITDIISMRLGPAQAAEWTGRLR
jgi:hypothetical protein